MLMRKLCSVSFLQSVYRKDYVAFASSDTTLTAEKKDKLRQGLQSLSKDDKVLTKATSLVDSSMDEMDKIRARSFLPHNYNYDPPNNVAQIIEDVAYELNVPTSGEEMCFPSLTIKAKFLLKIGEKLNHQVPSGQLHYIRNVKDAVTYFSTPVKNLTKYAAMARDENLPANVAIREHPIRFHPNDTHALHGGITAFPGEGGQVLSLRNQRLYRQFKPKVEWYDYEDQNFSHDPVDKGMPWDIEIANKMDRYTDRKFQKTGFRKT